MTQALKTTKTHANLEIERRRAAGKRMLGLFANTAKDRGPIDALIVNRRAEARAEDLQDEKAARRRRAGR